jgi:hypothetical protein
VDTQLKNPSLKHVKYNNMFVVFLLDYQLVLLTYNGFTWNTVLFTSFCFRISMYRVGHMGQISPQD